MTMSKRIFLTLITAILAITVIHAQKTDRVILKNGTTIIGDIEKIIPEESITINDRAGNIWVFSMADVSVIDKADLKRINGRQRCQHGLGEHEHDRCAGRIAEK
jgi:hypothetical protein